jgi:transposase InsO family protein
MSKTTSPSVGKPYGLERVCRVLEIPRSTIYAQEQRQAANVVLLQRARRGPKPKVSDADLLAAIRADLAASPFKIGNRFAALQPIAQGLKAEFGATGADAGRGLILRMDNGTQYTADDFLNQVKFWGITPSFAFVAEPQTNGVAERFNRTLKEQVIHGRLFRNLEEVRAAVTAFRDRYNRHWRLEKLGFMSPLEARQAYAMRKAA